MSARGSTSTPPRRRPAAGRARRAPAAGERRRPRPEAVAVAADPAAPAPAGPAPEVAAPVAAAPAVPAAAPVAAASAPAAAAPPLEAAADRILRSLPVRIARWTSAAVGFVATLLGVVFLLVPGLKPDEPPRDKGAALTNATVEWLTYGQYLDRVDTPPAGLDATALARTGILVEFDFAIDGYKDKPLHFATASSTPPAAIRSTARATCSSRPPSGAAGASSRCGSSGRAAPRSGCTSRCS